MKRKVFTLAAMLGIVALSSSPAYSGDGKPSWMGDATASFLFNSDATQTAGASPNTYNFRYAYHLGAFGDFDWLDYMVELGSTAGTAENKVVLLTGAGAVPVALNRAKFTIHVVDVLFLDFGRFDNPLALNGWDYIWDSDFKATGWGQRIEVENFFFNLVEHMVALSTAGGQPTVAAGSHLGTSGVILFGGNIGYNWEWTDEFSLLTVAEAFNVRNNTQVGANFAFNWDIAEGYPLVIWLGGYIPVSNTTGTGKTSTLSAKLQYGDLTVDDGYLLGIGATYIGADSFVADSNQPNAGGYLVNPYGSERLARVAGALLATGSATAGSVINVGIDAWYRWYSWFRLGIETDFGFSSSTGLTDSSFVHAELVAATEF